MIATPSIALLMAISSPKTVDAHPLGPSRIVVDGVLDEPAWAEANADQRAR